MAATLTLPTGVYRKLADGASERGMTIESLLAVVSELVAPDQRAQPKGRAIEQLLERFRDGELTTDDRDKLNELIHVDYQEAIARADQLIDAKMQRENGHSSPRKAKRIRK